MQAVGQSGEAATDLAEPFCIEATPEVFSALSTLFQLVGKRVHASMQTSIEVVVAAQVLKSIPTVGSAEEQLCISVLSLIRANLRRLVSSQIGIDNVGVLVCSL